MIQGQLEMAEDEATGPQAAFSHLSSRNFRRLADLIEGTCGIRMPPQKKTLVEGRLRRRTKALGLAGLNEYCDALFDRGDAGDELIHLIDAITTNKTDFFREEDHFNFLLDTALPQLAAAGCGMRRPLKIWSAACSIGAEPYSLAMVAHHFAGLQRGFRYSILATDICTEVLQRAVQGIFPADMAKPIPGQFRQRYLMRAKNKAAGLVRIVPELRTAIEFGRLNLMDDSYPVESDYDIIFCRNILIYFSKPRQEKVLRQLCGHLRKGGLLFVGHTETVIGFDLPAKAVAPAVFQRI